MNPLAQTRSFEAPRGGASSGGSLEKIGRFEVLEKIGKGSMGVVYLARDPMIGRWVAVKKLTGIKGKLLDPDVVRRLLINEARNVGALEHPGIVMVFDLIEGQDGKVQALAMEYVAGKSLRQRLNEPEPMSLSYVSEIISSVADVLDYAHENGCIHRDIKPANILLGDDGSIKVADFGIAALRGEDLATELQNLGTPNYLAPERVLGQPGDQHTDIYSLGVILYELLTRNLPFQAVNISELVQKIIQERPIPPERFAPEMMGGLRRILGRALAKEPADRYPSAGELASDLREIVAAQAALNDTVPAPARPMPSKLESPAAGQPRPEAVPESASPARPQELDRQPVEVLSRVEPEVVEWQTGTPEGGEDEPTESKVAAVVRRGADLVTMALSTIARRAPGAWLKLRSLIRPGFRAVRARPALAALLAFVMALPLLLVALSNGEVPEAAEGAIEGEAPDEVRYFGLLRASRSLASNGNGEAAAQALALAETLFPETREEVRREALLEIAGEAELARLQRVDELIGEAHLEIARADYAGAARSIAFLSELQASQEDLELLESSLRRSRSRLRMAQRPPEPDPEPVAAAPAPVTEPVVKRSVKRAPVRTGPGILKVELSSARPRGVLTVYLGGNQILNRPYRFTEKKNFFVRKGISGSFRESMELAEGVRELKIYLSQPKRETQLRTVTVKIPAGDIRVLRLRVQADGKLVVGSS